MHQRCMDGKACHGYDQKLCTHRTFFNMVLSICFINLMGMGDSPPAIVGLFSAMV